MPPVLQLRQQIFSEGEGSLGGCFRKYTGVIAERHYARGFGVVWAETIIRWWGLQGLWQRVSQPEVVI
jgi:hypothetical protein